MNATQPALMPKNLRCRVLSFRFTTVALALLMLIAPGSRAQQAPPPVAQPAPVTASAAQTYKPVEGDFVAHDFHFKSGETLPELHLHYRTLGTPTRDASGRVTNAVLILHGTGGWGGNFLVPQFAGVLYGPGQLLDITRYYIILPDGIGHGKSSKPSDGMHAHFPQYEYDDMVAAQHLLVEQGLGVNHLRLIMGTSMGCMHSWIWGETYPDFMDALMPLACLPVQIAGRNRLWRKMLMSGIREDPDWQNGDYTTEPRAGLEIAADLLVIAGSAPLPMQNSLPTRDAADRWLQDVMKRETETLDANDLLYAVNCFAELRSFRRSWENFRAGDVREFRRRFHQSAGVGHRRARNPKSEKWEIRAAAAFGADPWPRHAHLGRPVATILERTIG